MIESRRRPSGLVVCGPQIRWPGPRQAIHRSGAALRALGVLDSDAVDGLARSVA
jgi:hypothetical protein